MFVAGCCHVCSLFYSLGSCFTPGNTTFRFFPDRREMEPIKWPRMWGRRMEMRRNRPICIRALLLVLFHVVTASTGSRVTGPGRRLRLVAPLTMSLYGFSLVNHRANAHRRPPVTAATPWGFTGPDEKPTSRPQLGFTLASDREEGGAELTRRQRKRLTLVKGLTVTVFASLLVKNKSPPSKLSLR